ncbi:hypothetical protein [Microcoleus sp. CAWBG58]|uniref:hypothetical protein n=1 Tax=Microcoleus sp. CAWBG58 TaxID=2841651 RepID=UPI0025F68DCD|nr:hypothetical protein [Microcoleus sp. CAWBG58]
MYIDKSAEAQQRTFIEYDGQLSTVNCQLSTVNCQLSTDLPFIKKCCFFANILLHLFT